MSAYPRLKPGVQIHTELGDELLLALQTHGVRTTSPHAAQIVRYFDGAHEVGEIASGLAIDPADVAQLQNILGEHELLELSSQPMATPELEGSKRFRFEQRQLECDLITHRHHRNDGGASELVARSTFTILISGENRLARTLLALLQSMGLVHTRIITRGHLSHRITAHDVCGVTTQMSDVGKLRSEFHQEIIREAQLPNGTSVAKSKPDLIISTIPIEWDYVQRWLSEGSAHLHINPVIGRNVELGPLVIPGQSACLRCVALTKRDLALPVEHETLRKELPTASISYVAGLVAATVAEFVATGSSPLLGASAWLDLLNPLGEVERRYWSKHWECGCTD
jgi:hypothetical protein